MQFVFIKGSGKQNATRKKGRLDRAAFALSDNIEVSATPVPECWQVSLPPLRAL